MPQSKYIRQVYDILAERELIRLQAGQIPRPNAEQAFYSIRNSLKHRPDNRYSNILAYDRTAVSVEGRYINANVVTDGKGGEWVAAQAPLPSAFDTFYRALYLGSATNKKPNDVIMVQLTGWEERGMVKADPYISAGVGRTGTFIALSSLRQPGEVTLASPLPPLPNDLSQDSVALTVDAIRECRRMLVQTPEQLQLIYDMQ
ncbi:uncharacterized protein L201_007377 [Kwoniella dendrophila CBS 6074]|uniref:Tyrosine specific protein phosphatases domain-containing protein n=1 Tax=Kwoniella dendrophila CBS 6074 TaxID=1295534 RepID=A0AAX4K6I7_9TREE